MQSVSPLVALMAMTILGAACNSGEVDPHGDDTHYIEALWAEQYDSIRELAGAADLVVVGVVKGPAGSREDIRTAGAVTSSLVLTEFQIKPLETLKGTPGAKGILVNQTGGITSSGARTEVSDDPLFETGATYLLFLSYYEASNTYAVLGGPQGRFVVNGGPLRSVSSLSRHYPSRGIEDLAIDGLPLAAVAKETRAASASAPEQRNP